MSNNSNKIKVNWELLDDEQKMHIQHRLASTYMQLINLKKIVIGQTVSIKISISFEQSLPPKFVIIKFGVTATDIIPENKKIKHLPAKIIVEDLDVYNDENKLAWLDQTNDIELDEKNSNTSISFYSKLNPNQEEFKIEDSDAFLKENPEIDEQLGNMVKNLLEETKNNNISTENKIQTNEIFERNSNNELFDFYDSEQLNYSPSEYVKIVNSHARFLLSQVFESLVNKDSMELNEMVNINIELVKSLQRKLSHCDFNLFTKTELLEMGFINWQNKYLLIPIWLLPVMVNNNKEMLLYNIRTKETFSLGSIQPKYQTIRFGCSYYGIIISNLKFKE